MDYDAIKFIFTEYLKEKGHNPIDGYDNLIVPEYLGVKIYFFGDYIGVWYATDGNTIRYPYPDISDLKFNPEEYCKMILPTLQ